VDDLPLEISEVYHIEVHDPDRPHARSSQIERERRTQPTSADCEHPRRLEFPLACDADLGQQQVTGVAKHLGMGKRRLNGGARRAACDAGYDGKHVSGLDRGRGRREMSNIGFVEVQVYEVSQAAVVLQQMAPETCVHVQQSIEHLAYRAARELHCILSAGEASKRSGDRDSYRHGIIPH
jgi:hypothetical protein